MGLIAIGGWGFKCVGFPTYSIKFPSIEGAFLFPRTRSSKYKNHNGSFVNKVYSVRTIILLFFTSHI